MQQKSAFSSVLGLMSGTSLDGIDLALCNFNKQNGHFVFEIVKSETRPYSDWWKQKLSTAHALSAEKYFSLHAQYGAYMAEVVNDFLKDTTRPDALASHGHTVFHQPAAGFSTQIGCGATLAAHTGITTVCDFRSTDVALGGQGAPLVPIGDAMLFQDYEACLNIGGISNISLGNLTNRKAYDIGIANMLLNFLAEQQGQAFDRNGEMARAGNVLPELFFQLEQLDYYKQKGARSLGREWFDASVKPLFGRADKRDELATATEHVAERIASDINEQKISSVLVTGGGALNTFLIERIRAKTTANLIIPSLQLINFKEALIFAFLGHLRLNSEITALATVTGASRNSGGAAVYPGH